MEKNEITEFKDALLKFVKRASKEGATADEVEALPAVAELFAQITGLVV